MPSQPEYDAIVIGSGMGGLAFASIMAKLRRWRVLVLERHFKIGGFTHTFTRPGGWSWDVGLHYVGEMGEGIMGRRLLFRHRKPGEVEPDQPEHGEDSREHCPVGSGIVHDTPGDQRSRKDAPAAAHP